MFYIVEKWPNEDPVFAFDEFGDVAAFDNELDADKFVEELNYGTVIYLPE